MRKLLFLLVLVFFFIVRGSTSVLAQGTYGCSLTGSACAMVSINCLSGYIPDSAHPCGNIAPANCNATTYTCVPNPFLATPPPCPGHCDIGCIGSYTDIGQLSCPGIAPHCCVSGAGTSGSTGGTPTSISNPCAPGVWTALGCVPTDPSAFVATFLGWVIGIAGGIAFLLILYGGFQILGSSGDPEKLNEGKEIIVSALAGVLMIVFSVLLLRIIGLDILKIPGFGP